MDQTTPSTGSRIAQSRRAKGLTQIDLAQLCHVDSQTVSRWERNTINPDFEHLALLAQVLGTSPTWLASGDEGAALPVSVVKNLEAKLADFETHLQQWIQRESQDRKSLEDKVNAFMAKVDGTKDQIAEQLVQSEITQMALWPAPLRALHELLAQCKTLNAEELKQAGEAAGAVTLSPEFEALAKTVNELARQDKNIR